MTDLTKHDVALIGVRLLSIYIALQLIGSIPAWISTLSMAVDLMSSTSFSSSVSYPYFRTIAAICLLLLGLLIPILLWIFASPIAQRITKGTYTGVIENNDMPVANIKDIQTMLFCAIGVYVFVTTAPGFISLIYLYVKAANSFEQVWGSVPRFIVYFLQIIFSLWLIFSAEGLSNLIYKLRYAGHKK